MIGVVLLSHGEMAEGMKKSCELFFGDNIANLACCQLYEGMAPETYDKKIDEALKEVDDGSGVVVMCDLFGGTPSNRVMKRASNRIEVITGMNMAMLLELLGSRLSIKDVSGLDMEKLIATSQSGIKWINGMMNQRKNNG